MSTLTEALTDHVTEYNPEMGDLGLGKKVSLADFKVAEEALLNSGYRRFKTPGRDGSDAEWITTYSASGMVAAFVWAGFIKHSDGKHLVCAFQVPIHEFEEN